MWHRFSTGSAQVGNLCHMNPPVENRCHKERDDFTLRLSSDGIEGHSITAVAADDTITDDRACVKCGYALRGLPPSQVFAQAMVAFELAAADPRVAGVNLVMPEDWHVPMRDHDLHMRMFRFLRNAYAGVNVALHAGELALGVVPPENLGLHVRQAIEVGGAQRIGHGTDVMDDADPEALLREMAVQPRAAWRTVQLDVPHRLYQTPRVIDQRVHLRPYGPTPLRQLFIKDLGHEQPTVLLTNDLRATPSALIIRYARRMLIENGLADAVNFLHLDVLSSAVALNVSFDVLLTTMATGLYRLLALKLRGFERAQPRQIWRRFLKSRLMSA